jgi:hypothetical protein
MPCFTLSLWISEVRPFIMEDEDYKKLSSKRSIGIGKRWIVFLLARGKFHSVQSLLKDSGQDFGERTLY